MALTKVSTDGVKDDAVTTDKVANAINTSIAANTAKDLTALSASNLTSGTVPDARFPATLPAKSAANLTSIPAGNLTGTVADARISALTASKLTGALPAISAANLTNVPAANITGTLPAISGANLTGIAGGLVSFKHAPISAYQVIQSTSLTLTNLQITYTPVDGANNKIYVLMTGNFEFDGNDNNHHQFIIKCTGQHTTDLPLTSQRVGSDISSVPNTTSLSMLLRDPNITGNAAITYRAGVYCEDVTNSQHRMRNNLALTVFEIDPSANQN